MVISKCKINFRGILDLFGFYFWRDFRISIFFVFKSILNKYVFIF